MDHRRGTRARFGWCADGDGPRAGCVLCRWPGARLQPVCIGRHAPTSFGDRRERAARQWGHLCATAATGAAAFAVGYVPQLAAYQAVNGHPSPTELVSRKMNWLSPHFLAVMFSPEHGLFVWTPLALIGVIGLVALAAGRSGSRYRDASWVGALALLMVGTAGVHLGQRRVMDRRRILRSAPVRRTHAADCAWPCCRLVRRVAVAHTTLACTVSIVGIGVAIWWQVGLAAQFGMNTMDSFGSACRHATTRAPAFWSCPFRCRPSSGDI